jgi:2-amino-4-hydroxy-6-hydroxymethyldihydropteridine diphosphokinase
VLEIREVIAVERISSIWLTEPVGLREQPAFYNAALAGHSTLAPHPLLEALLRIERRMGRRRDAGAVRMGPRTIDLDLLVYDGLEADEPGLVLPHPRMRARRFVLAPLAEIAPELRIGSEARTVGELLRELPPDAAVERLDVEGWPPSWG